MLHPKLMGLSPSHSSNSRSISELILSTGNLAVSYGNHNEHTEHIGLSIATLNYQGVYSSRNRFHPCPKYNDCPVPVSIGCRSPSIISNQLYN